jgi:DNA-binding NarL/FixJ family response regulator
MLNPIIFAVLAVSASASCWTIYRKLKGRIHTLEQDLQYISDAVSQMAEIQMKTYQKHSARLEEMEERIMELCVPSHNPNLPLERRHQVLALARQGVALEDIARRLKAPVGEAEMIINLQKYMSGGHFRSAGMNGQVGNYA